MHRQPYLLLLVFFIFSCKDAAIERPVVNKPYDTSTRIAGFSAALAQAKIFADSGRYAEALVSLQKQKAGDTGHYKCGTTSNIEYGESLDLYVRIFLESGDTAAAIKWLRNPLLLNGITLFPSIGPYYYLNRIWHMQYTPDEIRREVRDAAGRISFEKIKDSYYAEVEIFGHPFNLGYMDENGKINNGEMVVDMNSTGSSGITRAFQKFYRQTYFYRNIDQPAESYDEVLEDVIARYYPELQ